MAIATLAVEAGYRGYFTNAEEMVANNAVVFNIKGPAWRLREHHALTAATTDTTHERRHS